MYVCNNNERSKYIICKYYFFGESVLYQKNVQHKRFNVLWKLFLGGEEKETKEQTGICWSESPSGGHKMELHLNLKIFLFCYNHMNTQKLLHSDIYRSNNDLIFQSVNLPCVLHADKLQ